MAYTTINKPSDYFNTLTWTGNGTNPRSFTGVGFQPDLVWSKRRNDAAGHNLFDVIRGTGANAELCSNSTGAEGGNSAETYGYLNSFDSDGFSVQTGSTDNTYWNTNTHTYVAWNWLADNTSGSSNTDGTITSNVSANTTSGFSIVSYTANGTAGATIGHGLGAVPQVIITKDRSATSNWFMYHVGTDATAPEDKYMELESTDAVQDFPVWNDTAPTSSVFSIGTASGNNTNGNDIIAYCFAEKKGFSKFGSYTGNGSSDGTFVYTGMRPAFVIVKRTDSSTNGNWVMHDSARGGSNVIDARLFPNTSDAESSNGNGAIDFLSNGFKYRTSSDGQNGSGNAMFYMAFAENPLVTTGKVPATAR